MNRWQMNRWQVNRWQVNRWALTIAASLTLAAMAAGCRSAPTSTGSRPSPQPPASIQVAIHSQTPGSDESDKGDLAALNADLAGIDAASQAAADDVGAADQAAMQNDNP